MVEENAKTQHWSLPYDFLRSRSPRRMPWFHVASTSILTTQWQFRWRYWANQSMLVIWYAAACPESKQSVVVIVLFITHSNPKCLQLAILFIVFQTWAFVEDSPVWKGPVWFRSSVVPLQIICSLASGRSTELCARVLHCLRRLSLGQSSKK